MEVDTFLFIISLIGFICTFINVELQNKAKFSSAKMVPTVIIFLIFTFLIIANGIKLIVS